MKDSTKASIAIIETKIEELDILSANASEDKLSWFSVKWNFAFNK